MAGEADQAHGQPGSEKWVTWTDTVPSRLEKWLRDEALWLGAWWDREHRAADVARVGVEGVVLGEALLQWDVASSWVVGEGEEEQAVLGVVAAAQDRRLGRDADVGVGVEPVEHRRVVEAPAGERGAGALVAADDALLLVLRQAVPRVQDLDPPDDEERPAEHGGALAAGDPDVAVEVARA